MKPISQFNSSQIKVLFTDIDGTLTDDGRLPANSYQALWRLKEAGLIVVPVTGRPAGWCEMIARLWPVDAVVGENGALIFALKNGRMQRHWVRDKSLRIADRQKLKTIRTEVLKTVRGCKVASDQFARLFDLAIDFAEDVPALPLSDVQRIADVFTKHGATAKISNIHVNGWFGDYDKVSTCQFYLRSQMAMNEARMKSDCAFVGDSPNDEPMFAFFPNSFAVANIQQFLNQLKHKPGFITTKPEGSGFCQVTERILANLKSRSPG